MKVSNHEKHGATRYRFDDWKFVPLGFNAEGQQQCFGHSKNRTMSSTVGAYQSIRHLRNVD